jgi:hypothetical protein
MLPNVQTTCEHKKMQTSYDYEEMQFAQVHITIENKCP